MAARQCKGTTKKGAQCKAAPLHDSDYCLAHSDAETRSSMQFVGGQPGSGRPRLPRVTELQRAWLEEHANEVLEPYVRAIRGAMVTVTYEGVVTVTEIPDLAGRIAAAEKLQDRILGKPRQMTEVTGVDGGPIEHALNLAALSEEELDALEQLVARASDPEPD